jgi:hypothetical protein
MLQVLRPTKTFEHQQFQILSSCGIKAHRITVSLNTERHATISNS